MTQLTQAQGYAGGYDFGIWVYQGENTRRPLGLMKRQLTRCVLQLFGRKHVSSWSYLGNKILTF